MRLDKVIHTYFFLPAFQTELYPFNGKQKDVIGNTDTGKKARENCNFNDDLKWRLCVCAVCRTFGGMFSIDDVIIGCIAFSLGQLNA